MRTLAQRSAGLAWLCALGFTFSSGPAEAGCGCEKPPPVPAEIRPHVTYPGTDVTLFHPGLVDGEKYWVEFASGTSAESARVMATAVFKRDQADAQAKSQVVVSLPPLPLGPTSVSVRRINDGAPVLEVTDDGFTVAPYPVTVPDSIGKLQLHDYQAAVSRDGIVFLSLDLSELQNPKTIQAQAKSYPLRFTGDDVVFYNTQGFLMQLLDESIPGLFSVGVSDGSGSDILHYSRHEFASFYAMHDERQAHELDADDANWHLDGSPHIDHDAMILAIAGEFDDGSVPDAGATRGFKLEILTYSLFRHGLVGDSYVDLKNNTSTDSFDGAGGGVGSEGDVLTNGMLSLKGNAVVNGNARAAALDIRDQGRVTGGTIVGDSPTEFLPVYMPSKLPDLGGLVVGRNKDKTLTGPASYRFSSLTVRRGGRLNIDNSAGPVVLYVTGPVDVREGGLVVPIDLDPEKFALYVDGPHVVQLAGDAAFYGVVYAPDALIDLAGQGQFFGAFVGYGVKLSDEAAVHYDMSLRENSGPTSNGHWNPDVFAAALTNASPDSATDAAPSPSATTSAAPAAKKNNGKAKGKKK